MPKFVKWHEALDFDGVKPVGSMNIALRWQLAIAAVYVASYIAIVGLMKIRGGQNRKDIVGYMAFTLPLLASAGVLRGVTLQGGGLGYMLCGPLLNLSILIGTGCDPFRAILSRSEYERLKVYRNMVSRVLRFEERPIPKKMPCQWPVLTLFFGAVGLLASLWPQWFGMEGY